jgi:hypothetical protein
MASVMLLNLLWSLIVLSQLEDSSDNEGRFRFSNLTDGEFTLQANGFPVGNEEYESQSAKSAHSITARLK